MFLEDMGLLIAKNHLPMQFVESLSMKHLCLHLCPRLVFPSKKQFPQKMFPKLVEKTKQLYVLPTLVECNYVIMNFDLWMSKGTHDIFVLVISILEVYSQPKFVTFGLFETTKISRKILVKKLLELLEKYNLKKKIIVYVKDERFNLVTMTFALKML